MSGYIFLAYLGHTPFSTAGLRIDAEKGFGDKLMSIAAAHPSISKVTDIGLAQTERQ